MKGTQPRPQLLALEPRLLFDGAAATAVDQQSDDGGQDGGAPTTDQDAPHQGATPGEREGGEADQQAKRHLVVIDARLDPEQRNAIVAGLAVDAELIEVGSTDNGIEAITAALAGMDGVESIEIFSHGAGGQFQLGDQRVAADTLASLDGQLGQWRDALAADADLLLYGCRIGAGDAGQGLVDALAAATGADVGASNDDTGAVALGGDWELETFHGDLDRQGALDAVALSAVSGVLADADAEVSLASPGDSVPLGESFSFTVSLDNASSQTGYAPFINLYVPTTGKDGDDGITVDSATYLGESLETILVTFDPGGEAVHPVAKDANGNALVLVASDYGLRAGDSLVVVLLPFASLTSDQPTLDVVVNARLSSFADTAQTSSSPELVIKAQGGFEFGNDALDNPQDDPSLLGASLVNYTVMPTVIKVEQSLDMAEGETASGQNYGHTLTTTVSPAGAGTDVQALTNVVITQPIPDNVQVTAIDPGAGGELTSITLASGATVTQPGLIQLLINRDDIFITEYSVEYASLSGPASSTVSFYVPETDASGDAILDPDTGNDKEITFDPPTGSGDWVPLDPRDRDPDSADGTVNFSGSGDALSFIAKSITLQKTATISVDAGTSGVTPGDTLSYELEIALSDYFAFGKDRQLEGQFLVTDTLGNGQTLDGTPTLTVYNGATATIIPLVSTTTTNADGTTTTVFDIAQSLEDFYGDENWLAGDAAFDETIDGGATRAVIAYTATVGDAYTGVTDHPAVNEGDAFGNDALVDATLVIDENNLTGESEADDSNTELTVPISDVDIAIEGGVTELAPGDDVTFTLRYDLVTGDHENFQLIAYLPLPLLDASGIAWSEGSGSGTWAFAADNTWAGTITGVESGPGNSIVFTFDDLTADAASSIAVSFTMTVGDQPFADGRSLNVLAESHQTTTLDKTELISQDVVKVQSVAEPVVSITHGVVASTGGTVTGTTGTWSPPGTSGAPFDGSVTDPAAVDGDVTDIDAGDTLRLATLLENTGGGGAFDVTTSIELPTDLTFIGGNLASANLTLTLGDGSVLVEDTDYSVSGTTITLLDAGGLATLLAGRDGSASDAAGSNILVITYDVIVASAVAASRTLGTTATLENYASINGGADFTPTDQGDDATQQVAAPTITKTFANGSLSDDDSSELHTDGANLVVGESMLYDIVVTLPEGSTQSLTVDDLIPPGMALDTSFNSDIGYELITLTSGSGALSANFAGSLTFGSLTGVGGTLGDDGADGRFTFTASSAAADNAEGNNSFVIRLRLIATDTLANQQGVTHDNSAALGYSDIDGDEVNGTTAVDRSVALDGAAPRTTLVEPTVTIEQTLTTPSDPGLGVDEGDAIEYQLSLDNAAGGIDAFDLSFDSAISAQLDAPFLVSVAIDGTTYNASDANNPFEIVGNATDGYRLVSKDDANIDLAAGDQIVIIVSATVGATAADQANLATEASVQWTSLNETSESPGVERTGVDGELGSGVLNDYQSTDTLLIPVAQTLQVSRLGGLADTAAANPTSGASENVAIGEIIRYRVVALIPEGTNSGYTLTIQVDEGLTIPPEVANNILIAFIANGGGLTSDETTGADIVTGNGQSAEAGDIGASTAGSPTGVLATSRYTISADGRTLTIDLGDLTNADTDDDREGISLEFNVRVDNSAGDPAGNQAGKELGMTVTETRGGQSFTSERVIERIVEPSFTGLDKTVTDVDPAPGNANGSATVEVGFTHNGGMPAYEVELTDSFPDGSGYALIGVTIDGTTYNAGSLPPGVVDASDANNIRVTFETLAPGAKISLSYSVEVPNDAPIAAANALATLTWSSLPDDGTFDTYRGTDVGADGATDGERIGTADGSDANDYILTAGAGLGIVEGTLWNDTADANGVQDAGEAGFANRTVTLTWAGADGIFGNSDDKTFDPTTTNAQGQYRFGVLPTGLYRIDAAETFSATTAGDVRARYDSDGDTYGDGSLSTIDIDLADSATSTASIGYVELNDTPVNDLPASATGEEDESFAISGLSISDPDALTPGTSGANSLEVILEVTRGMLSIASAGDATITGNDSATVTLAGSVADINAALATLRYQGNANLNGSDTLTMTTNDAGNFGDNPDLALGDGIPGQADQDALSDVDTLTLTIEPVNDAPIANPDTAIAIEAGGSDNNQVGRDPNGFVLANDIDVDLANEGDTLTVISAGIAGGTQQSVPAADDGTGDLSIDGNYGTLVIRADGFARYVVDNDNTEVQALRLSSQTLTETFDYTLADAEGLSTGSTITITIEGANDTPVGVDDSATAVEAGGVANATGGQDATGNVLDNDTDVDSVANGETKAVSGARSGDKDELGDYTDVATETDIVGTYGTLTINADGSYRYVVDNDNVEVQRLSGPSDTLEETFSYRVTDAGDLDGVANLVITIAGNQDNPVATDNSTSAQAPSTDGATPAVDGSGNLIGDDDGDGVDADVDSVDRPASELSITGIRTGNESAGGTLTSLGSAGAGVNGQYGRLTVSADGDYTYAVDGDNADVQALAAGATLTETFTYQVTDTAGNVDLAELVVTVVGVNDPPNGVDDSATAIEAGGTANASPGLDPSGNVLNNDSDIDGQTLSVTALRYGATNGTLGHGLTAAYGTLTLDADGRYTYVVDNDNADVQALRTTGDTLDEFFTYTLTDPLGASAEATLTITIEGRNDTPIAINDTSDATEAGGTDNATPGIDPSGNVLTNDTDVDAGDAHSVSGIRVGSEAAGGAFTTVSGSQALTGQFGTLTIAADGSYSYVVDNTNARVQALNPGQSLSDVFTYRMADSTGARDIAELNVTVRGAWDAPLTTNDLALAVADTPVNPTPGVDPSGNLLDNDSDVDNSDQLTVAGVRTGLEAAGPVADSMTGDGISLDGLYGTLTVMPDGSYTYVVDDAAVAALGPISFVTDVFTYSARDLGGLTDNAELKVYVRGRNDAPIAGADAGDAIEAGGTNNATPGSPASGNVLANDTDPDAGINPGGLLDPNLAVIEVRTGGMGGSGDSSPLGNPLIGQYGALTLNADGSYTYVVDDSLASVQALRRSGQTMSETFTYTIDDRWSATASAELTITIDGRNDTPVARDDSSVAVEAGGVDNATPGVDPDGNVLTNDSDVDSVANGETNTVVSVSQGASSAVAGQALKGRYGTLTLLANGDYRYDVDNDDPTVQALRTSGQTLTERFSYVMRDRAGDTATARLTIVVQGANDTPTARDDSGLASDQTPSPQTRGNVLPNDGDVDGGDALSVVDTRLQQGGSVSLAGDALSGRYGTLVLGADGSYTYAIDLTNTEVLAASGLGPVLNDVFVYRISDRSGATTEATLTITLDIAAPYIPIRDGAGPHVGGLVGPDSDELSLPDIDPVVYVTPQVESTSRVALGYQRINGTAPGWMVSGPEIQSPSLGEWLGEVDGRFVERGVALSRAFAEQDQILLLGRHGRTSLSADGLLSDPSLFAPTREGLTGGQFADPDSTPDSTPGADPSADPGRPTEANDGAAAPAPGGDTRPQLPAGAEWIGERVGESQAVHAPNTAAYAKEAAPAAPSFRQQLRGAAGSLPLALEFDLGAARPLDSRSPFAKDDLS
ncbi:VCBS domain-containing protein [Halomonas sp. V046]|uniref:VCBS domain-containing protein n=1 Tax=Halomonas sp. V046 TaxID=3459611 RepID=UPI0040445C27